MNTSFISQRKKASEQSDAASKEALRRALLFTVGGATIGGGLNAFRRRKKPKPIIKTTDSMAAEGPTFVSLNNSASLENPTDWIRPGGALVNTKYMVPRGSLISALKDRWINFGKSANDNVFSNVASTIWDKGVKPLGLDTVLDPGQTTNPNSKWWGSASMLGGGTVGAYGGWKFIDWLANKRDSAAKRHDLSSAEREYMDALNELHSVAKTANEVKVAGDGANSDGYTSVWTSNPWTAVKNTFGTATNAATGLAALTGIPVGMLVYNYVRKGGKNKALQSALYHRQRLRQAMRPSPVMLLASDEDKT